MDGITYHRGLRRFYGHRTGGQPEHLRPHNSGAGANAHTSPNAGLHCRTDYHANADVTPDSYADCRAFSDTDRYNAANGYAHSDSNDSACGDTDTYAHGRTDSDTDSSANSDTHAYPDPDTD